MRLILTLFLVGTLQLAYAQKGASHYEEAVMKYNSKDFRGALSAIEKALELDTRNLLYYDIKAKCLFQLEDYNSAFVTYDKAIVIDPRKAFLYGNRALLRFSIQEFDYAIDDYTVAMELAESDSIRNYYLADRATAKKQKRDFEGAYQDLLVAYQFDSTSVTTLMDLGGICDEVGQGDKALGYLYKAIEEDPSFYYVYTNIGFKYQEMGQYERAITCFDTLLKHNPKEPLGYSNRSYCKLKIGDTKGALEDIEMSMKLYPTNSYAYRIRALIYIQKGETDRACLDLQSALNLGFEKIYGDEVTKLREQYCSE